MGVLLFQGLGGTGARYSVRQDSPSLPLHIDAQAQALSVLHSAVPVWFYEQPNYSGASFVIVRGGGCNDLANCIAGAGNWRNRIRSIKFRSAASGALTEDNLFELTEPLHREAEQISPPTGADFQLTDFTEMPLRGDIRPLINTHYSRKRFISRSGGRLYGSWQPTFNHACIFDGLGYLEESSVIRLEDVGTCSGGDTVVMCSHH